MIHFFHQFNKAIDAGKDVAASVETAVHNTFMPILATSLAMTAGFAAYAESSMSNVVAFGLVVGLAAILGLIADLVLSPAIAAALYARRSRADEPDAAILTMTPARS